MFFVCGFGCVSVREGGRERDRERRRERYGDMEMQKSKESVYVYWIRGRSEAMNFCL